MKPVPVKTPGFKLLPLSLELDSFLCLSNPKPISGFGIERTLYLHGDIDTDPLLLKSTFLCRLRE